MTSEEFKRFCEDVKAEIVKSAPKDTGNLAYNAIRLKMPSIGTCEIYISGNTTKTPNGYVNYGIAPYAPFTIEPWISPKWNGRTNPNEGWWENAIANAVKVVANKYRGEVK